MKPYYWKHFVGPMAVSVCTIAACAPLTTDAQSHPLVSQTGKTVQLEGHFAGWAACPSSTAKTRSDWVLQYTDAAGAQCVFVSGGLPQGVVAPPSTASNGLPVAVKGVVMVADTGKPFVQWVQ